MRRAVAFAADVFWTLLALSLFYAPRAGVELWANIMDRWNGEG